MILIVVSVLFKFQSTDSLDAPLMLAPTKPDVVVKSEIIVEPQTSVYKADVERVAPINNKPLQARVLDETTLQDKIEQDQAQEYLNSALQLINSPQHEQRIEGLEFLSVYQKPETEAVFARLLVTDENAEVRNMAALNLGSFHTLLDSTLYDLILALADPSKEVRFSALSTLENTMTSLDKASTSYQNIYAQLSLKATSTELPQDIREAMSQIVNQDALKPSNPSNS